MSDLEELLEAVDEVIGAENLALKELEGVVDQPERMACPHIEKLREVRAKFPAVAS